VPGVIASGTMASFEVLEHTADIGFAARADTPGELFRESARALISIAVDTESVMPRETWRLEVTGHDHPSLLVNFLEEILYLFDTNQFAPRDCEVHALDDGLHLRGQLIGERREAARHPWRLIVKAVTYHGLEAAFHDDGWRARVFLDV
jgi:SHS2 domain-containing protein